MAETHTHQEPGPTGLPPSGLIRSVLPAILPGLVILVLLFFAVFSHLLPRFEKSLMDHKRAMAQELTCTAWTILQDYANQVPHELSLEDAQAQAIARVRALRYGPEGKDYFWINDMHPTMIMHPYRTELDGTDISDFKDQAGKALFVEMVRVVQEDGAGFVDYLWWWKDSERIEPKISYVKGFQPWGWVIGTGIYIEDVNQEIARMRSQMQKASMFLLALVTLIMVLIVGQAAVAQNRRTRAEATLRQSEAKFRGIFDRAFQFIGLLDAEGRLIDINETALGFAGVSKDDVLGRFYWDTPWWAYSERGRQQLREGLKDCRYGVTVRFEVKQKDASGANKIIDFSAKPLLDEGGRVVRIVAESRDITRMADLQEQLRQSQKMEALGQLAGGIAHDFNNLLTSIIGNAELLMADAKPESEEAELCDEIIVASTRSADLTRQLLSFSRKGQLQNTPIDLHVLVREVAQLLSRSIDRRITIVQELEAENPTVVGDPTMLQNALLNLGVNARDAMSKGSGAEGQADRLTFHTNNVAVDRAYLEEHSLDLTPGQYVCVSIGDTGCGIEPDLVARIFEPFFSTKPTGKGTGLGLASVYGCAQSHRGTITVSSTPNEGSTFTLYLPEGAIQIQEDAPETGAVVHVGGNIMLVDDDESLRKTTERALKHMGYTVTTCCDGAEAVEYYKDHVADIDLIILDLIMPRMGGEEAFQRLMAIDRNVRILISSGYSRNRAVDDLIAAGACGFLGKPFQLEKLARTVSHLLRATKPA